MRVIRRFSASVTGTTVTTLLVLLSIGQAQDRSQAPNETYKTTIKNFGCINSNYYRGAQPDSEGYRELAALGVKTVIDLQRDGERDEQQLVEAAGMKFFRIRMSDRSSPSYEQAAEFLKIVSDPANQPIYVHCKGGRHRTGAMTAVYRIEHDGWSAEKAVQEMKAFDFNRGFGHGSLKDFVFAYYQNYERKPVAATVSAESGTK
jgi:protein tyrosine/serine phosphatase